MAGRILIVDDERNITFVIQAILEKAGFETVVLNESKQALELIRTGDFNVLITDLYMPDVTGMQILEECQKSFPRLPVVMMTAFGTIEAAVSALKKGAFDFITKPFDQNELLMVIKKAVSTYQQRQLEPVLTKGISLHGEASSIIGKSEPILDVFKMILKISNSPSTILVWGESGTGKELVAYEIHQHSDRAQKPFIKINCAAIPSALIESELFGFEKGAFTGAVASKPGRFELAHEGTLFLDEVGEMPLEMQVKLLRVLQEQEFERVGGVSSIRVNVRIIAATNKDLQHEVKEGRFREDLFYRLNVIPIHLPPLRERKEDIELLAPHFIENFNIKLKKNILGLTPQALECFQLFSWPGNIRQLENVLERMVLMCDGNELSLEDLPPEILGLRKIESSLPLGEVPEMSFKEVIRQKTQILEKDLIEKVLEEMKGNVTRTAEKLGLSRKGLQLKMKELRLKRPLE